MTAALAAAAAFAGAVCRHLVDVVARRRGAARFPVGTMVVNLTGSFALGLLVGLVPGHRHGGSVLLVAGTGFVGAYTTFSTFAYETVRLVEDGWTRAALLNAAVSTGAGLAAAGAGLALAGVR